MVAIGSYDSHNGKGWKTISSVNDTTYILPVLRKQGFADENIQILVNEQATIENIRLEIQKLIKNTNKGDVVYIHFSAHGAQIEDDNGDEIDGLDEAIVTYHAISPRHSTDFDKDSKNYLRDDEIGELTQLIRRAAGPSGDLLVVMDNCHSGSGTRSVGLTRGGEIPLLSKNKKALPQKRDETISADKLIKDDKLANQIVISASRADQLNTETVFNGLGVGSLSLAVSKAMMNMESNTTYAGFFARIQSEMAVTVPKQHPVLEGTFVNREFWGGSFKVPPPYSKILVADDPDFVTIEGGTTSGLTPGSEVHVYPVDTYDTTKVKPLSRGYIKKTENFRSSVELTSDLPEISTAYWVFIKRLNYPVKPFSISFQSDPNLGEKPLDTKRKKEIEEFIASNEQIDAQGEIALRLVEKSGSEILVDAKSDFEFYRMSPDREIKDQLVEAIQRYSQYSFLKSYVLSDSNYKVQIRFVPHESNKTENFKMGAYTFQVGDTFRMEITNNSKFDIYFNVLDLDPEGNINAIFPNKKERIYSHDLKVKAGETLLVKYNIIIYPPAGEEVFKIFISKSELDLEGIARSKGQNTRNMMTDIEKVFKSSYKPSTRSVSSAKDGIVMNIPFTIVN